MTEADPIVADVVVVGAGGAGLPAALAARRSGADVVCLDENHDVGGHAILSGGRLPLGGGTSLQRKYGIEDSPDRIYQDFTGPSSSAMPWLGGLRLADRELVRAWAEACAPTYEFLVEHGVPIDTRAPTTVVNGEPDGQPPGAATRLVVPQMDDELDLAVTIAGNGGAGLIRPLERSARRHGVRFLLRHRLVGLVRESDGDRRVVAVRAVHEDREIVIKARRGVILATGGHTSNVSFRRMFDPRLTEEYQVAGEPWSRQSAAGEISAMELGAALWGAGSQCQGGLEMTKTAHIGCRYGYVRLKWDPRSPMFAAAGASGLSVVDWQDVILVDQTGRRFWDETDASRAFFDACLAPHGSAVANGGGPIWAVFDHAAVVREEWEPQPPHVDERGWFFRANSLEELAERIENPYQREPMSSDALRATVDRYNRFVDEGRDADYGKPSPQYRIDTPPYYAAWATPTLHDSIAGVRIDRHARVIDLGGEPISGLYAAGETSGGFPYHGLPGAVVFGWIAGRHAALAGAAPS